MNELIAKVKELAAELVADAELQAEKGNKAAGTRARKASLTLEKVLKEFPDISTIFGEVKPENYASQNAFLHAGYTETYRVFQMVRDGEHGK